MRRSGRGVYKKRLGKNLYRSIIVAKSGQYWVYEFLFAKKDLANISRAELTGYRQLAGAYSRLMPQQVDRLIQEQDWFEIHMDDGKEPHDAGKS